MSDQQAALLAAIPRLAGHQVLVIGDVILDEYLTGTATRLSREAAVPVIEFESRRTIPGGAANPAMNIAALGSQVRLIGLRGHDSAGEELIRRLSQAQIEARLVVDPTRCTSQKTRLIAQGSLRFPQQLARLDRLDRHPPDSTTTETIIDEIRAGLVDCAAVIVSDYRNGLLTSAIVQAVRIEAAKRGCLLLVDSQGALDKYAGYDIVRVNQRDTETYLRRSLSDETEITQAARELLTALQAKGIIIGRGAQGVSLGEPDSGYHHIRPANVTEVFDVTGAGDTSIAVLSLGLLAGLNLAEAALLANYAAGLVVQRLGNAAPTPAELAKAIQEWGTD